MLLTLIAAVDEAGAIGRSGGGLPWQVPDEAAHFRRQCRSRWLLLGRRTYQEMEGWFAEWARVEPSTAPTPLLLTRKPQPGALRQAATVEEALQIAHSAGQEELLVIGGAQTFAAALPFATQLILSRIHAHSGGTVFFPFFDEAAWHLTRREGPYRDTSSGLTYTISWLSRHGATLRTPI